MSGKSEPTANLLAAYQSGDAAAFDALFKATGPLLYSYLLSRLRAVADAEDAFQETWIRVHKYIMAYDPGQNGLGWLFSIARNVASDVWRGAGAAQAAGIRPDDLAGETPDPEIVTAARQELERLLAALSPQDRQLVRSRIVESGSHESIARKAGTTQEQARQRWSRLVRKLRAARGATG